MRFVIFSSLSLIKICEIYHIIISHITFDGILMNFFFFGIDQQICFTSVQQLRMMILIHSSFDEIVGDFM